MSSSNLKPAPSSSQARRHVAKGKRNTARAKATAKAAPKKAVAKTPAKQSTAKPTTAKSATAKSTIAKSTTAKSPRRSAQPSPPAESSSATQTTHAANAEPGSDGVAREQSPNLIGHDLETGGSSNGSAQPTLPGAGEKAADETLSTQGESTPTLRRPDGSSESRTSPSLLLRVKCDPPDEDAWSDLLHLYGTIVYDWARSFGVQDSDAANLVQIVFRRVAGAIGRFEPHYEKGSFRAWLWRITRNELNRFFTDRKKRPSAIGGDDAGAMLHSVADPQADDPVGDDLVVEGLIGDDHAEPNPESTHIRILRNALELIRPEFSDNVWNSFLKMTIEEKTMNEAAEELGISPGAVRTGKYRVVLRLRELLRGSEDYPLGNDPDDSDYNPHLDELAE